MEEKTVYSEWKEEIATEQLNSGYINLVFAEWCKENGWIVLSHNEGRDSVWIRSYSEDQAMPIAELYKLFRSTTKK